MSSPRSPMPPVPMVMARFAQPSKPPIAALRLTGSVVTYQDRDGDDHISPSKEHAVTANEASQDRTAATKASERPVQTATEPETVRRDGDALPNSGAVVDNYEIVRSLGKGGMGQVLLARDIRLGRMVALKFLIGDHHKHVRRFMVEARATARLSHENIVTLHDIAEYGDVPYMVLEYVRGLSLDRWLARRDSTGAHSEVAGLSNALSPGRATELMIPVVRAMVCAHGADIVHRDLKPSNIMMGEDGSVKVFDFGIAKLLGSDVQPPTWGSDVDDMAVTRAGSVVGTMTYMAPEQWWAKSIDHRADLWAVGIILYRLVTGQHPLAPLSLDRLKTVAKLNLPMPRVSDMRPDVGKLGAIIDRCLIKRRDDRMNSAEELLGELESLVRHRRQASALAHHDDNPYTGLAAFQEHDAERFYGRDQAIRQVVARLAEIPLVAVVGPSGAGKSSFVRAGVIPALKHDDLCEAFVVRPGRRPLGALANLLVEHGSHLTNPPSIRTPRTAKRPFAAQRRAAQPANSTSQHAEHVARLRAEPGYIGVILRARARRKRARIALVVDQFEELYTLAAVDERAPFLQCLAGLADDVSSPVRVILSLRTDFLDQVTADASPANQQIARGILPLWTMGRDDLRRALCQPLDAVEHRFESDQMVSDILDELAPTASALPLMQFTASKLWEMRDRERRVLTAASYRELGGVAGALTHHADAVLASLNTAEERWARTILTRLVTPDRTRAVVPLAELRLLATAGDREDSDPQTTDHAAQMDRVIDRLVAARLLTVEGRDHNESTIELVHESLIVRWPTLSRWLSESQEDAAFVARVRAAAAEWERGDRRDGLLWRGDAAREASRWYRRFRTETKSDGATRSGDVDAIRALSARDRRYLQAVVDLSQRARRLRRRLTIATMAFLSVVAIVVSLLALRANRAAMRADEQAAEAARHAERATSESIQARNAGRMAAAREQQSDPTLVLALVREIEPSHPPKRWADLARWALQRDIAEVVLTHRKGVASAAFSPDGTRILTVANDSTVRLWNADGSGPPVVLFEHPRPVTSAAFSPDGARIVTSSRDRKARVWNADGTGQPRIFDGHANLVHWAAFSKDGKRIATTSRDRTARVWNADGSGEPLVLRGHREGVRSAAFSPDGTRIVTTSNDKTVRVWNADGSGEPLVLRGHQHRVSTAAFSPDGALIVTASADKTVRVWNADGSGEPLVLRGHQGFVSCAAFGPEGRRIVSASHDKTARVWNTDGTGEPRVLRGHRDLVMSAAFSADGRRIVTASHDKTVRVWRADRTGQFVILYGHREVVNSAAYSADGTRIVTASNDNTARVWRADGTGQPFVLRGHQDFVFSAAFSPDGTRIVTASRDRTAQVWNADSAGPPLVRLSHPQRVNAAAFNPDGTRIVTAVTDSTVRVWNADGTGEPIVLRGHRHIVNSAVFSPNGTHIVTASHDKTARIWNADGTGEAIVLSGHTDVVYSAGYSPNGAHIVTTSYDTTARIWNADGTGEPIVLSGHESAVGAGMRGQRAFSPDSARILTFSDDRTLRVWNVDGANQPLILRAPNFNALSAAFSPDGTRIISTSHTEHIASPSGGERTEHAVWIWTDIEPFTGLHDPKLWTATSFCPPIKLRMELLGTPEPKAREHLKRCLHRVAQTRNSGASQRIDGDRERTDEDRDR